MDRTVCGMCGCWIGDDLHAEIKHLRAERDALKTALKNISACPSSDHMWLRSIAEAAIRTMKERK